MKLRRREILEGVLIILLGAAVLSLIGYLKGALNGLGLSQLALWLWSQFLRPVGVPIGLLFIAGATIVPSCVRRLYQGRTKSATALGVYSSTNLPLLSTPLSPDENLILEVFVRTKDTHLMDLGLEELLGNSNIRLAQAREGLAEKGYVDILSPIWSGDPPHLRLTQRGRNWVLEHTPDDA